MAVGDSALCRRSRSFQRLLRHSCPPTRSPFISRMSPRVLLILYATETGTTQDVADKVARELRRIHFKCRISSIDQYPIVGRPLPVFELLYFFITNYTLVRTNNRTANTLPNVNNRLWTSSTTPPPPLAYTPSLRPSPGPIRRDVLLYIFAWR